MGVSPTIFPNQVSGASRCGMLPPVHNDGANPHPSPASRPNRRAAEDGFHEEAVMV